MDKKTEKRTPVRAIRAMCVHCMGDNVREPRNCPSKSCPLWPYRLGKRPRSEEEWGLS